MPISTIRRSVPMLLASLALCAAAFPSRAAADVIRKGEGTRRQQLDKMELKQFPADGWKGLTWSGAAPAPADLDGKPVLVVMWADWREVSIKGLKLATRLGERFAKEGLVVVAVHNATGFTDASKPTIGEGGKLFVAHDSKGDFRKSILSDSDPDFYVIDRAGQMRFARITTESVEEAVTTVIKEGQSDAKGVLDKLKAEADRKAAEAARSSAINNQLDMTSIPEQPYTQPDEDLYTKAGFRKYSLAEKGATNKDDEAKTLQLPDEGYYPSKPQTQGRCVVVYFWNHLVPQSWDPGMAEMDKLQRKYGRDVAFVGVWTPLKLEGIDDEKLKNELKDEQGLERVQQRLTAMAKGRSFGHSMVLDPQGTILAGIRSNDLQMQMGWMPYAAVCSSEGRVRFQGAYKWPQFIGTIEEVLRVDPGVKRRRAAEETYIRARQGADPAVPAPAGGGDSK
jgi:thiol-disulfide isomerase/thioredoxin